MKKVLAWLKVNWPIVLCSLVILGALPAGIIIGGSFQQKLVDDVKTTVEADFKDLNADKMTYDIPAPIPGQPKFDFAGQPPNARVIEEFSKRREELSGQLGSVAGQAVEFNRGDHKPLIDGLFPDPPTAGQQKRAEFTKAYIALADKLIATVNGGPPPAQAAVFDTVRTFKDQQVIKATTELGKDVKEMPVERIDQIREQLVEMRKNAYRARAQEISLYIERDAIESIPPKIPERDFDMRESWDRQEQAWVLQDLFKAIKNVNDRAAAEAGGAGVPASVVKRVMAVIMVPHPFISTAMPAAPEGTDALTEKLEGSAAPTGPAVVQLDPKRVSGRASGWSAKNMAFDVRRIQVSVIVSTQRLPLLLDELTATNFITATIANITGVPARDQLELGYYYGEEHVVKLDLVLEWCWLREWTGPLMPAEIKKMVGYKEPVADEPAKKPAKPEPKPDGGTPGGGG